MYNKTAETRVKMANILKPTLNHLEKLISAMANPASNTPLVGEIIFIKPFQNWLLRTTTSRLTFIRSPNGAITGIVNAAAPEEDGTKKETIT